MITYNSFIDDDEKRQALIRSMHRRYVPGPRPLDTTAEGPTGRDKRHIRIGSTVLIVEKENQGVGKQTEGRIIRILTPRAYHPRGIKVILDNGKIGRVQQILVY